MINGPGHQNMRWRELDEVRLHAAPEPVSEAISGSGMIVRGANAAVQLHQTIYAAHEVALKSERLDPGLVAFYDFDPRAVAPYNRLVISLISAAATRKLQRVLIASAQYGDGRTSVTLNLAAALARAGKRALVVESDFQRPSALRLLGIDAETGLAEAIEKGLEPSQAMIGLQPIGFKLLPTRAQVENSAELLASPAFDVMMQMLRPEFDFILFDSAPLLAVADAGLLELHTDATLLVIRQGRTSTSQMAKAVALLNEERLLGALLNRVVN
jgi:capsular exopolysaccharide synthesis family protein